jgi:hypothetical protein
MPDPPVAIADASALIAFFNAADRWQGTQPSDS